MESCPVFLDSRLRGNDGREGNDGSRSRCVRFKGQTYATVSLLPSGEGGIDICPVYAGWPEAEAIRILCDALRKKTKRLSKADIPRPWVLLLWADGCLVDARHYQRVRDLPHEFDNFEAVFVVEDELTGFPLPRRTPPTADPEG